MIQTKTERVMQAPIAWRDPDGTMQDLSPSASHPVCRYRPQDQRSLAELVRMADKLKLSHPKVESVLNQGLITSLLLLNGFRRTGN